MKFFKIFLLASGLMAGLYSCSKTDSAIDASVGSLKVNDTTGDCFPVIIHGTYIAGVPLNSDNYIDVEVNVTAAGTYTISTDSINGMSFKGTGRLGYTGVNRIRLYSYGKPLQAGLTTFNIDYNGTHCSASMIVGSLPSGAFSLKDTSGNPLGAAAVTGAYTAGVQLGADDSVMVQIFVTKTGSLFLSSNNNDGISFSGSGVFTTTGLHTITLIGTGVPQIPGQYNFTVLDSLSDSSNFNITVVPFGNGTSAAFELAGTPGACAGFTQFGTYTAGVRLQLEDSVTTQVNVTTAGPYSIVTAPVNGVIFSATGIFDSAGIYTIALKGSGTPIQPGTFNYTAVGNTSNCTFSITFAQGLGIFTLGGTPGGCTGFTLGSGSYKTDSALTLNNTVTLDVNVVTPGSYSINTSTVNGIRFSATGTFITTGPTQLTLLGSGTPEAPGTFNFAVPSRAGNCMFSINVNPSAAIFTMGSSAYGGCTGFKLNGAYKAGVALTSANTLVAQVNVTFPGPYSLTTGTIDGMEFSIQDTFKTTGTQSITLHGTGKPTAIGTYNGSLGTFPNDCSFTINVTGTGGGTSAFTLGGAPGSCAGFSLAGIYMANASLSGSNTVTAQVNVTTAGTYSIATNLVNGISFSGTGTFTGTGVQTVTLTGSGTPTAAGSFNYTATAGSSTCTFSVTVVDATGSITCKVNGTSKTFNVSAGATMTSSPVQTLSMTGVASASSSETILLTISKTSGNITTGTYDQNGQAAGIIVSATYIDASSNSYLAGTSLNSLSIQITSITATHVTGTFTGTLKDGNGSGTNTATLTSGTFDLPIH